MQRIRKLVLLGLTALSLLAASGSTALAWCGTPYPGSRVPVPIPQPDPFNPVDIVKIPVKVIVGGP